MSDDEKKQPDKKSGVGGVLGKKRTTLILVGVMIILVGLVVLNSIRMSEVDADEVGILVDNWSGDIQVIDRAGTVFYNGWISAFYTLDKKQQELHMTADPSQGSRAGADQVSITTRDGYSVDVDITLYYSLDLHNASVNRADLVRRIFSESGQGDAYKDKWIRDYARAVCRYVFGELTTEEFYVAKMRGEKQGKALAMLNDYLVPKGLRVSSINIQEFNFDRQYEALIDKKKNADQAVERLYAELGSKKKELETAKQKAKNKKDTTLAGFKLELEQAVIEAEGKALQHVKQAEAKAERIIQKALASKYQLEQEAAAILAERQSEAEGLTERVNALEGSGGRELVMRAYAAKLKGLLIKGRPFATGNVVSPVEIKNTGAR